MRTKSEAINYRVVVDPNVFTCGIRTGDEKTVCETLVADIKRHCIDVARCTIEFDQDNVCSFCGGSWTEDGNVFNGGCCNEDMKNDPNALKGV